MEILEKLSDKELFEKCRLYGAEIRKWTRKFAALLPEVARRELYKKYGFYSIFEFAAKLAGMKHETVIEILRVAQKLEDKPLLRAQIETHGWSKLHLVANIATKENEKMWAEKVKTMSKPTLEIFIRETRKQNAEIVQIRPRTEEEQTGMSVLLPYKQQASQKSPHQNRNYVRLLLTPKNELKLKELQKKLSREQKAPVDLNEVIGTLLDVYDSAQPDTAAVAAPDAPSALAIAAAAADAQPASSRYIPVKIKKWLYSRYEGRCAFPGCTKLPEIYHHTRRFCLYPNHNPAYLVPLCKNHEQLAHNGLIENEEKPPGQWYVKLDAEKTGPKYFVDGLVNGYRRAPTTPCP